MLKRANRDWRIAFASVSEQAAGESRSEKTSRELSWYFDGERLLNDWLRIGGERVEPRKEEELHCREVEQRNALSLSPFLLKKQKGAGKVKARCND
jgi:hypothetical protein